MFAVGVGAADGKGAGAEGGPAAEEAAEEATGG